MRCAIAWLLLAACRTAGSPSPSDVAWHAPIEIAAGGGTKGPWQQNESRYDFVDDPTVVLGGDRTHVAWVDHRDKDVHFARFPDGKAVNVSRTPAVFSWLPRVVVDGEHVHVLWQEIVFSGGTHGGEIFYTRSTNGGASFEPPQNLSRSIEGDGKGRITEDIWHNGSLDLVAARDGLHAAWTTYDGLLFHATSRDGTAWSKPQQIGGSASRPARAPALAAGDAVYLAWTHGESRDADIHVAVRADAAWSTPVVIARTPTYSDAPKLGVGADGTLHVAYAETAGDAFADSRVVYTRSRDGARSFETPRTLSRGEASFPSLAVDGAAVVVTWELGSAAANRDARGLGIAISRDRGERFSPPSVIPGSRDRSGVNGSQQGRLMRKLSLRDGQIAVVNSALRPGERSRVWLIRGHLRALR